MAYACAAETRGPHAAGFSLVLSRDGVEPGDHSPRGRQASVRGDGAVVTDATRVGAVRATACDHTPFRLGGTWTGPARQPRCASDSHSSHAGPAQIQLRSPALSSGPPLGCCRREKKMQRRASAEALCIHCPFKEIGGGSTAVGASR